ncbi:ribosome biogenesis protein Rrp12 [Schizosaccharomyces cryophilus OY26]|uniref:Ribosome biogenesis protein Rrp12 n=1 Tax=Schizosaccharomyces cryophilus (strain OY26 / ATCC MYA-4695 / CBS 11777 / NBRC 106824 / NRRL Y48691) TaxID=653667 RepID=S9X624_SCHCR|nr:ribosome biogenesis protein Rrp12 [Schizosaccharomyces cryophilus OY26]EPY52557.1 ribosome biogenesis protein Rrp12 [Schizosaccharomyces cryophilus OY26]
MIQVHGSLENDLRKLRTLPSKGDINEFDILVSAIESSLEEQKTNASPTAYLIALLALIKEINDLNRSMRIQTFQLLEVIVKHVAPNVLQAKLPHIMSVLVPIVNREESNKAFFVHYLNVIERLLVAQDYSSWIKGDSCKTAIYILLFFALSTAEKPRTRALQVISKVLKSPPPGPVFEHPAMKYVTSEPLRLLEALSVAKKSKTPAEIQRLNHGLLLVRTICLSAPWPSAYLMKLCNVCTQIIEQRSTQSIHLVFQIYEGLCKKFSDTTNFEGLRLALTTLQKLQPSEYDSQLLVPWLKAMNSAVESLNELSKAEAVSDCVARFSRVFTLLESDSVEVRLEAATTLCTIISCLDGTSESLPIASQLCNHLCDALKSVHYRFAYPECFQIISRLCETLGKASDPVLIPALKLIDYIRGAETFDGKVLADEVIGSFVRVLGPETVLRVLPLNLEMQTANAVGRAWLLPVLRDNTLFTNLSHFSSYFIPLSGSLYQKVLDMDDLDSVPAKLYQTLVDQIWTLLPGYCYLPVDLQQAFTNDFAGILVNVLYEQVSLRSVICNSLTLLVETNHKVANNIPLQVAVPAPLDAQEASQNLQYLGSIASNFLSVLLNVFSSTSSQYRYPILKCIQTWLSISPPDTVSSVYKKITDLLPNSLDELAGSYKISGDSSATPMAYSLMDLLVVLSQFLNQEYCPALFNYVQEFLNHQDTAIQKKAYKLLSAMLRTEFGREFAAQNMVKVFELLFSVSNRVVSSTRKDRLVSLTELFKIQSDELNSVIPRVLPEAIIATREVNERARSAAFQLLMTIAASAVESNLFGESTPVRVEKFLSVISAGLAGSSTHMISAAIIAISSVVLEYKSYITQQFLLELMNTMNLFMKSANREIAKAAIDFTKIASSTLPPDFVKPLLPELIPNLLAWSHESKGHFRAKVKHILEKMVRKFGVAAVEPYVPINDKKLISNIRKTQERNLRKRGQKREEKPVAAVPRKSFASAYEQAVYDTESEDEEEDMDESMEDTNNARMEKSYVKEDDEDEPLDLLDMEAISKISSTDPSKQTNRKPAAPSSSFKSNEEGLLLFDESEPESDGNEGLIGAKEHAEVNRQYMEAVSGEASFQRGLNNKLKFSNKRVRDDFDEDMEEADGTSSSKKSQQARKTFSKNRSKKQKKPKGY